MVISHTRPTYPMSMRIAGLEGRVVVAFTADVDGRVRNPYVVESNNPAFDEPAVEAVLHWRFKPGTKDGRAVATSMRVPMVFQIQDAGSNRFKVTTKHGYRERLPPELRFDTAPELINIDAAVYPYPALLAKQRGEVDVSFIINPKGRVVLVKVLKSPGDDFSEAVRAMMDSLRFKPALKAGQPTYALLQMGLQFDPEYGDVQLGKSGRRILRELQQGDQAAIVAAADLDQPLLPVSRKPPVFPHSLVGKVQSGHALIEFFVDQYGQAQLPHILSASQPEFGYAACQAINTWRFHPPMRHGELVAAKVRIPVDFKLVDKPAQDSGG